MDDEIYDLSSRMEPGAKAFGNKFDLAPELCAHLSIAISLKRIADAFDASDSGGRPQGTVLWWLETIASAANAGRS